MQLFCIGGALWLYGGVLQKLWHAAAVAEPVVPPPFFPVEFSVQGGLILILSTPGGGMKG